MPELMHLLQGELVVLAGIAVLVAVGVLISRYVGRPSAGRHSQGRRCPTSTVAGLRTREHADQLRYYPTAGKAASTSKKQ